MENRLKQLLKTIKLNENMLSMLFGVVTVLLIGVLVFRMYSANKPEITPLADQTEQASEKVGEVAVEVKEDGQKFPAELPEKVTVAQGEYLWSIAEKYYGSGYNWVDIAEENGLKNADVVSVGQELKLPRVAVRELKVAVSSTGGASLAGESKIEGTSYTVVKGDHLWGIAVRAYGDGYKWGEIARANQLTQPNYIEVGQILNLPR